MALSCEPRSTTPLRADVAGDLAGSRVASDRALLKAAQERQPAFLRDLAAFVNIDSGTDDAAGLDRVSELLSARLKELGATVEVRSAPPSAGKIVRGIFEGTGSARVLLMIHYDTVFGKGEAQRRPMKIDGNKAFGPGGRRRQRGDRDHPACPCDRPSARAARLSHRHRALHPRRRKGLARLA
jgi:hypothetical protein